MKIITFFEELKAATCTSIKLDSISIQRTLLSIQYAHGNCLILKKPTLHNGSLKILVRKCYIDAFELMKQSQQYYNFVIGTKGTGKSQFLIYILWTLLLQNSTNFALYVKTIHTFIYVTVAQGTANFKVSSSVQETDLLLFDDCELCKEERQLISQFTKVIAILTDGHSMVKFLYGYGYSRLFVLPTWEAGVQLSAIENAFVYYQSHSVEEDCETSAAEYVDFELEIPQCCQSLDDIYAMLPEEFRLLHQSCYSHITTKQEVLKCIPRCGLIPRTLFSRSFDSSMDYVNKFLTRSNNLLQIAYSTIDLKTDFPSSLFCYDATDDFSLPVNFNFTSSFVRNEFIQTVIDLQVQQRIDYYHKIQISPSAVALRGTMFEAFIHDCLSGTVKTSITRAKRVFSNRSSIDSDLGEFTVPTVGKKLFNSYEDLQEGMYCQPVDRKFAAVDAIRWDVNEHDVTVVRLYQMTVASRPHGFVMTPLVNLIKYIASCRHIEDHTILDSTEIIFQLITVVPVDKFQATSYQPFLTKHQRHATKIDRLLIGSNVHQYVIAYDRLV